MHKYFKRVLAVNSILEKDSIRKGKRAAQSYVLKFSRINSAALDQPATRFSAPLSLSLRRVKIYNCWRLLGERNL